MRRLILLRHAKSDWPAGVDDFERPLAKRGIADATAVGRELASIAVPDVVLCSPARRTRQTWELASQALVPVPPTRFPPTVYGAGVPDLLGLVRRLSPASATVLIVGHQPTMSATAIALAGPGSNQADLARLRSKYPTSAIAVLRVNDNEGWADVGPTGAVLERFLVPRGQTSP